MDVLPLHESKAFSKSEEELDVVAQTQSFWDIRNYRKVVRRIDDGAKLSSDLIKMIQERAEIEAKHIKHLQQWSKKWDDHISKGPEYGTLENGWKALFLESARLAELHSECHKMMEELSKTVSEWRSQHYHKVIGGRWKETKKAEEGFQKAQKPWEKNFDRVNKAKKAYHQAAKELENACNALSTAEQNPAENSQEQIQKLQERKDKMERETARLKRKYSDWLDDLLHLKKHYTDDMKREFDKCQDFEKLRIEFFRDTLMSLKKSLDISQEKLVCIYQVCEHTVSQINPEEDLQWYSLHYGADMPYAWPEFEEYVLDTHSLKSSDNISSMESQSPVPVISEDVNHVYESTSDYWQEPPPASPGTILEEDSQGRKDDFDDGSGVLMRALYDYKGEDHDDLEFSVGDIVRIVEYCDGGWAKAFLGEEYGYVPSAYFETVNREL